jgi:hypothetical protein
MLRHPAEVMKDSWYEDEKCALLMLNMLATDMLANDQALRSGAAWLCDFAAKCNPVAANLLGRGVANTSVSGGSDGKTNDLEKRKALAKARQQQAMEKMKLQMAKFAQAVGEDDVSDDEISVQEPSNSPHRDAVESFDQPTFGTPIRVRTESDANYTSIHAMDLGSPGDFILTTPPMPSYPTTPRTPCSSGTVTPKNISHHAVNRLLSKRPQCIICGGSDSITQINQQTEDKSLAFCAYAQPSTVGKGGGGPLGGDPMRRHVGVFVSLCGHAVHSSCCDSYLKTSVSRDDRYIDRLEGSKKKEFRCPLCQRLSNSLVPFIDVGVDWVDIPQKGMTDTTPVAQLDDNVMVLGDASCSLQNFLSTTRWWSRNMKSVLWDGHCSFSTDVGEVDSKPSIPQLSTPTLTMKRHVFGKKDLISAWNRILKTPRIGQRSARSATPNKTSDKDLALPNFDAERQKIANVWRRFMDTICDSALTTDTIRFGADSLMKDYGEFRHYMSEKAFYNELNESAGKELMDVSYTLRSLLPLHQYR